MSEEEKICGGCGQKNNPLFTTCWKCGADFKTGLKTGVPLVPSERYEWVASRAWFGVILFSALMLGGAVVIRAFGRGSVAVNVYAMVLLLVWASVCMQTERGEWGKSRKIPFVILALIIEKGLMVPIAIMLGITIGITGWRWLSAGIEPLACFVVAIWSMWHSNLFVTKVRT